MFPFCPTSASLRCRSFSSLFCTGNSFGGFSTDWLADQVHCVSPQTVFPTELRVDLCYRMLGEAAASVYQHCYRNGCLTSGGVCSVCQWDVKLHAMILLVIYLYKVHYFLSDDSNLRDFTLAWEVHWALTQPCSTLGCLKGKKETYCLSFCLSMCFICICLDIVVFFYTMKTWFGKF